MSGGRFMRRSRTRRRPFTASFRRANNGDFEHEEQRVDFATKEAAFEAPSSRRKGRSAKRSRCGFPLILVLTSADGGGRQN